MKKILGALFAISLFPSGLRAADVPAGQFLLLQRSPRALGMSNATTALADDAMPLFSNPAGMVSLEQTHIAAAVVGGADDDRTQTQLSIVYPDAHFNNAWGLHLSALDQDYTIYDLNADSQGSGGESNLGTGLSYAHHFGVHWNFGLTIQHLMQEVDGSSSLGVGDSKGETIAATLGAIWTAESDRWRYGLVAYNQGPPMKFDTKNNTSGGGGSGDDVDYDLPSGIRLGVAHRMLADKNLNLALDYDMPNYGDANINLGSEYWLGKRMAVRAGFAVMNGSADSSMTPSLGLGFVLGRIVLDFGYVMDMDGLPLIAANLGWKFGKRRGGDDDEAVLKVGSVKGQKLNIAVSDLKPVNVAEADALIVSEFVRSALVNTGTFRVVDRANMEKILAEFQFQQSGCTTEECAAQIGKMLNVQKMVVGSISLLRGTYYITASVVDVEKSEVEASQSTEAGSVKDLKSACKRLAERLSLAYK